MLRPMILGHLIALYRKEHSLSVRQMAKVIGVDHTSLWRFEAGEQGGITFPNLCKILQWVLNTRPE